MPDDIDFARLMEPVARELLGEPRREVHKRNELRWRKNDSLLVNLDKGTWWDFRDEIGGGVLDLIQVHEKLENGAALDWLRDRGHLPARDGVSGPKLISKPVAKPAPKATPTPAAPKAAPKGRRVEEATYDYVDEQGKLLFQVVRYLPKGFSQRRPDPDTEKKGHWIWDLQGVRRVPYRLPDLLEAVSQDRVIFIPEGEKKVEKLIGLGVPATCNAGGSKAWDPSLGEHLRGAHVVLLPDNDQPGRNHRDDLVKKLTGVVASIRVVDLPGLGEKGDIVNWVDEAGGTVEELWRLVEAAPLAEVLTETVEEPADAVEALASDLSEDGEPRIPSLDEFRAVGFVFDGDTPLEPPRYIVKPLLPAKGVGILGGQSGAGKTFTAVELASCLAEGRPFFGHRVVERVGTLIIAAEGAGTLANRLDAVRKAKGGGTNHPIVRREKVPDLSDPAQVLELQRWIRVLDAMMRQQFGVRLGLIIIDTLIAGFRLQDENNSAEAQRVITHMQMLGEPIDAFVLAVHHYGKDEATGLRGSSAYRAGADVVLSLLAERNQATGEVKGRSLNKAKLRDGEEGPVAGFGLRFVELGTDQDDEPFGACVVEPDLNASAAPAPRPVKESLQFVALKGAFDETMMRCGREVPVRNDGSRVKAVTVEELKDEFRRRYATGESDETKAATTVRKALSRALASLSKHGFYTALWNGQEWLWRLDP